MWGNVSPFFFLVVSLVFSKSCEAGTCDGKDRGLGPCGLGGKKGEVDEEEGVCVDE